MTSLLVYTDSKDIVTLEAKFLLLTEGSPTYPRPRFEAVDSNGARAREFPFAVTIWFSGRRPLQPCLHPASVKMQSSFVSNL